jgi:type VII secretion integral membrane protein EccD
VTATVGGRLTRITVSGALRRADLVLPSDEPVGLLVPDLVAMVGVHAVDGPGGYQLATADGTVLDPAASLHEAGVPDGAMIRLDTVAEAPPVPILHDVTDHVSDDADTKWGRWDPTALRWTATALVVVGAVAAAVLVSAVARGGLLAVGGIVVVAGAAMAAGAAHDDRLATPTRWRAAGVATALAGTGVALVGCTLAVDAAAVRLALGAGVVAVALAVVGVVTGNSRAALLGAGMLGGHLALWWALYIAVLPTVRIAAIVAVVATGLLGLLPRVAIATSGLAALDDRQAVDEPVTRLAAQAAVDAAHRGLALATIATAASAALAGWLLAASSNSWAQTLCGILAVTLLLRLRAFPLTVEVVVLLGAALTAIAGLLRLWHRLYPGQWWAVAATALAGSGVAFVLLAYRPRPHVRARARQLADRLEALAVVGSVPVAVGVFGVYARLLDTF